MRRCRCESSLSATARKWAAYGVTDLQPFLLPASLALGVIGALCLFYILSTLSRGRKSALGSEAASKTAGTMTISRGLDRCFWLNMRRSRDEHCSSACVFVYGCSKIPSR